MSEQEKPVTEVYLLGKQCQRCGSRRSAIDERFVGPHRCAHLSDEEAAERLADSNSEIKASEVLSGVFTEVYLPKRNGTE